MKPLRWYVLDVPATPDAQDAREAAAHELAKAEYHRPPSMWARLWEWLVHQWRYAEFIPGAPHWVSVVIALGLLVAAIIAVILIVRWAFLRREGRTRRACATDALFDDERDSAALRRAAEEAAQMKQWATAVIERFRAIIRSLDERGLLEEYPGLTAQEAGRAAATALASVASDLHRGADLFEAVRYGEISPTADEDEWMRELERRVAAAATTTPVEARV